MAGVLKIVDGEEDLSYFQQHQIVYAYIKPEQNGLSGQDLEQLILERRGVNFFSNKYCKLESRCRTP